MSYVYSPTDGTKILVYTYKEGALAAVAHDLKLQFHDFTITQNDKGDNFSAIIQSASLKVVCARKNQCDELHTLNEGDKKEIEKNIQKSVLQPLKCSIIRVSVQKDPHDQYTATIQVCQTQNIVTLKVEQANSGRIAKAQLKQSDFGIKPFSAMFGALKIRDQIDVEVFLPMLMGS